jgi:hypothetical protein
MSAIKRRSAEGLSTALESSLDEHLSGVRERITDRAYDLAAQTIRPPGDSQENEKVQVNLNNLSQATSEVIAGQHGHKSSFLVRFFEYFPPFTCVCAILCIAFAVLGLYALGSGVGSEVAKATSSFLDIAKIFAGAIVGSTASNVINSTKSKHKSR